MNADKKQIFKEFEISALISVYPQLEVFRLRRLRAIPAIQLIATIYPDESRSM
jgi:hypothetical protein